MPKAHRLTHADFDTFSPKRRERGSYLLLAWSEKPIDKPRFAVVVSKKVSAKAVTRNTIKRRVLGAFRKIGVPKRSGTWIVTARREASEATFQEILKDLDRLVAKI